MDLDHFILATFCLIDDIMIDLLSHRRLRPRGPAPALADSEVLTLEIISEYLSLNPDKAICTSFRHPYAPCFPALRPRHRTPFVRQAANRWHLKERIGPRLLTQTRCDPSLQLIDSFPLPVCQFARAYRCQRFRGEGAFGDDVLLR